MTFNNMFTKFLLSFTILFQFHLTTAQQTKYLTNDTVMWTTGNQFSFMANSIVETNNENKVISGSINKDQYIWTAERLIKFKSGSEIKFDEKGNAISGILAENCKLRTTRGFVFFLKDRHIGLNGTGKVIEGFSMRGIHARIQSKNILFKAGAYILFDELGNVICGTLAERTNLECTDGENRTFKTGSIVEFDEGFKAIVKNQ